MNLIEQHNVLKGLTDEKLQQEVAQPSGQTPPFLILTEISRRKQMRERYEGDRARKGVKPTTVAEDMTGGIGAMAPGMGGGVGAMSPGMGGGIGAMASGTGGATAGMPPGMPAFADGGMVGGIDYADIAQRYQQSLDGMAERKDRARALALLAAGAGIAGGKSSNFMRNIGQGVLPSVQQYGTAIDTAEDDEQAILRNLLDLQRVQGQDAFQMMELDWRKGQAERENELAERRLADDKEPAGVRTVDWYTNRATDEERTNYDRLNPPYNPNAVTGDDRLADDIRQIRQSVASAYPPVEPITLPEGVSVDEAVAERDRKISIATYQRVKEIHGRAAAEKFRVNAGLSEGDVVSAAAGGPPGGGAVVDWTEIYEAN